VKILCEFQQHMNLVLESRILVSVPYLADKNAKLVISITCGLCTNKPTLRYCHHTSRRK